MGYLTAIYLLYAILNRESGGAGKNGIYETGRPQQGWQKPRHAVVRSFQLSGRNPVSGNGVGAHGVDFRYTKICRYSQGPSYAAVCAGRVSRLMIFRYALAAPAKAAAPFRAATAPRYTAASAELLKKCTHFTYARLYVSVLCTARCSTRF
ncbi:hypothetical protein EVAR_22703_1 [Eumeta japonica]|uniref:Uncharacterized protein n=1 Tax=Eumeta variegata TaxID=151549 RepID=A0A4C1UTL3_EUMVA|nr:hypothetical protein EVAR_22703_1 [Eumeta japonica]